MKTGIVFETNGKKALVMQNDGAFLTVAARPGWRPGDVVTLQSTRAFMRPLYAAAACIAFVFCAGIYGAYAYFLDEKALVSVDVNPSIELGINRFDRVISVDGRNDQGKAMAARVDVKYKRYDEAVSALMRDESLAALIDENAFVTFSVQANDQKMQEDVMRALEAAAVSCLPEGGSGIQVECYAVTKQIVQDAHSHHVTAGKYMTLMQLKEVAPEVDINEYAHHGISEIKEQIACNGGAQRRGGCCRNPSNVQSGEPVPEDTENRSTDGLGAAEVPADGGHHGDHESHGSHNRHHRNQVS